ncbi:hypothetical protein B0H16DRAFT_1711700 [Mycena metata]|uniref:Uncharacterized protein n=1 Tax=Mycena metata TaxID=1033252 RepID=A0AAD7NWN9_9AGAR|nr:hypothetical protein B0H16DRAFT_1711700 [Mycena metata]
MIQPLSVHSPLEPHVSTQSVAANDLRAPLLNQPRSPWMQWSDGALAVLEESRRGRFNDQARNSLVDSRIAEISAKINLALEVAALARKDVQLVRQDMALGLKESEWALKEDTALAMLKQTKVIRQARTYTAKPKLARLQESLDELSTVLRFELFDRIMQVIDQDFKAQLSYVEIASLKAAKCNWVGCFVDSDDLVLTPGQLRTIARKASTALPPPTLTLFLYAHRAARLGSATDTPGAECQRTVDGVPLDVLYAQEFVTAHASAASYDALFFIGGRVPREGIRSEIAEVEAEVAELERV